MRKLREQIKGQIELLGESSMVGYQVDVMDLQVFAEDKPELDWKEGNCCYFVEYGRGIYYFNAPPQTLSFAEDCSSPEEYIADCKDLKEAELIIADVEADAEIEAALSDLEIENIDDIEE